MKSCYPGLQRRVQQDGRHGDVRAVLVYHHSSGSAAIHRGRKVLLRPKDYQGTEARVLGPVSRKILSLEMDLSSQITLVPIVFSMLKITR